MLTLNLATAQDPNPLPGILKVEVEALGATVALSMPPPGRTSPPVRFQPPSFPAPGYPIKIRYFLDERSVGVWVKGVGENDSINIFASRLDTPVLQTPGVLYVGNIVHGDLKTKATGHDCSVMCEKNGVPTIEECCVVCRDGNLVTETCC